MHTPLTPAEEIDLARSALAEGDYVHAAHHVAMALSEEPSREDWLAMLTAVVTESPDPDALLPLGEHPYHGTVAGRAHVLACQGQISQGLDLLFQLEDAFPDVGYLGWATRWVKAAPATPPLRLSRLIAVLINRNETTIGRVHLRPSEVAALERFEALLDALLERPEFWTDPGLLTATSGSMRRMGRSEEAIRLAEACVGHVEAHYGHVLLGLARRAMGAPLQAVAAFEEAARISPDDLSVTAELGRAWWDAGELERARECFGRVLADNPDDQELTIARDWLDWKLDGEPDGAWIEPNISAPLTPDDTRLLCTPFIGWLPEPTEASINIARQLAETERAQGTMPELLSVALTTLEPPSALMALALTCTGQADPAAMRFEVGKVPSDPDPREPTGHVEVPLWRYEGSRALKALPAPPREVQDAIARLASAPYYLPRWWQRAARVARSIEHHSDDALLAALIHPAPRIPDRIEPLRWVQLTQLAAACVIARLDEGWEGSRRARLLRSVAHGPEDWTVGAALIAMGEVALEHPEALTPIARFFEGFATHLPTGGRPGCVALPLALRYLQLPGRPRVQRSRFQDLLEEASRHN